MCDDAPWWMLALLAAWALARACGAVRRGMPVVDVRGMPVATRLRRDLLLAFEPLREWQERVRRWDGVRVERVDVLEACADGEQLDFLLLDVVAWREEDEGKDAGECADLLAVRAPRRLPGAVLLRGAQTAAVLAWYERRDGVWAVMVRSPRAAAGREVWEAPAGTVEWGGGGRLRGRPFELLRAATGVRCVDDLVFHPSACPLLDPSLTDAQLLLFSVKLPDHVADLLERNRACDPLAVRDVLAVRVRDDPAAHGDAKMLCLLAAAFPPP